MIQKIQEHLEENLRKQKGLGKQMKTAVDIHTCLESEGYDISYGTVLRTIKSLVHTQKEAFIKAEHQPGQVCEFDWGEVKLIIDGQKEPYKWLYLRPHTVILEWPICSLNKNRVFSRGSCIIFPRSKWCVPYNGL